MANLSYLARIAVFCSILINQKKKMSISSQLVKLNEVNQIESINKNKDYFSDLDNLIKNCVIYQFLEFDDLARLSSVSKSFKDAAFERNRFSDLDILKYAVRALNISKETSPSFHIMCIAYNIKMELIKERINLFFNKYTQIQHLQFTLIPSSIKYFILEKMNPKITVLRLDILNHQIDSEYILKKTPLKNLKSLNINSDSKDENRLAKLIEMAIPYFDNSRVNIISNSENPVITYFKWSPRTRSIQFNGLSNDFINHVLTICKNKYKYEQEIKMIK